MATKLKKRKPWVTFSFFAAAVSMLFVCISVFIGMRNNNTIVLDFKDKWEYKNAVGNVLYNCYSLALDQPLEKPGEDGTAVLYPSQTKYLDNEGDNIAYYIAAENYLPVATNTDFRDSDAFLNEITNSGLYEHIILLKGDQILQETKITLLGGFAHEGKLSDSDYYRLFSPYTSRLVESGRADQISVYLAVKSGDRLSNSKSNLSAIYNAYSWWYSQMVVLVLLAGVAAASIIILLVTIIKHKSLSMANAVIVRLMGKLWFEVKLVLTGFALLGGIYFADCVFWADWDVVFLFIPCFWWCWFVLLDIIYNKKRFFTNNIVHSLIKFMRSLENKHGFLERMKRRFVVLIVTEFVLVGLSVILLFIGRIGWIFSLLWIALGIYLLLRYLKEYNRNMDEFGLIIDYVEQIKSGTVTEPLILPQEDDFAPLAANLSDIHSGISLAVEEQVRSEKMKVELITNVSHDLKTPLTSIINYVDLLSAEDLKPDFANDYVKILAQKANRLKNLVQDLFEVSKANSRTIDMNLEQLDIVALVEQTVAEMDERVDIAGVEVKTQFSSQQMFVVADGKKLHRVFENLLGNALKYSLAGTRVYITVHQKQGVAEVTFKNVASYEMTFTAEDIVERFQRGDASRTTEGSGLGLAIAKSFVELNGGTLSIELDGDLFKAIIRLPVSTNIPSPAPVDGDDPVHEIIYDEPSAMPDAIEQNTQQDSLQTTC